VLGFVPGSCCAPCCQARLCIDTLSALLSQLSFSCAWHLASAVLIRLNEGLLITHMLCAWLALRYSARRSILHPRESNESFIGDSLKFIAVMLVSNSLSCGCQRHVHQPTQLLMRGVGQLSSCRACAALAQSSERNRC
jgi:hypothetical protein